MSDRARVLACLVALVAFVPQMASAQPAAPVLQASVSGQTVTATWAAVPGATSYRAEAGVTAGQMVAGYELGSLTTFSIAAPQGTYFLRVLARNAQGTSAPSNVVAVTVASAQTPPSPPTNLAASVSGTTVNFTVTLPPGQLTGLLLAGGVAPGQALGIVPVPLAPQSSLSNVPPGTYYARMYAVGAGGTSGASNEVQITVSPTACVPPSPPAVQVQVTGSTVAISWGAVPGVAGYQLAVAMAPGGAAVHTQPFAAAQTSVTYPGVPTGTYYARITAANSCGASATSADATIVVVPTGGTSGPRTPNPPAPTPPNYLPLPDRSAVVNDMARLYPNELRNSCIDTGGNNVWLYKVVERLRREDTRWGLNWKRARVGDMSQDVITYNFGPESDEGTLFVHAVDIIGGHCGSSPGPSWNNVTVLFSNGAKWTLQPYLQAGFPQYPQ